MPIYDFTCDSCGHTSSFITRSISATLEPVCRSCGSTHLQRVVSSFAVRKTVRQAHDEFGPTPAFPGDDFYEDSRNIGRNVEDTFQRHDMDMPGEVRDAIDSARDGNLPSGLDL
jgi:putative FmdB family regulatory protein